MLIFCYFFHCCLFTSLLFPLPSSIRRFPASGFFLLPSLPQVVAGVSQGICCRLPLPLPFALAFSFFFVCLFCFVLINLFKYKFVDLVVRFLL